MEDAISVLGRTGLLPIARGLDSSDLRRTAALLVEEDLPLLEVTMNTRGAASLIRELHEAFEGRLVLGAGTVLDPVLAETAVDAGAVFLVSPHWDPELAAAARRLGVPLIPGAFTPTEILAAWRAGAAMVKVFPAVAGGPEYLRQLRGPLPEIPLLPTGGITVDNAAEFIAAGAAALGVGGSLLRSEGADPARLRAQITAFKTAVAEGRRARA
ncbi:MAG TPA: bifunctional 4-hydroxy-2-oxoglutarate aldolase/2-dehydro-3-deoxy-phosphogluconate aldolase [bacterium]|jgi:2-dehydro-3-deoxyphosphogluconate aldolase/(4S)-4-hydroxy-2-oxoglutarate aldolase|nr:bifunctional 4-hydroxy-2-oxoglutarate aldolase/2-dehydro-3-deoxy-phosphogluconate aldolase [bacterium]